MHVAGESSSPTHRHRNICLEKTGFGEGGREGSKGSGQQRAGGHLRGSGAGEWVWRVWLLWPWSESARMSLYELSFLQ